MPEKWPPPTIGDIVWCRFPELPDKKPGPKPRPALVMKVEVREDGTIVEVAYGTSQRVAKPKVGEFTIRKASDPAAHKLAGLGYDTKFDFKQTISLRWGEDFFAVPPNAPNGQNPKLGTLHASVHRAAAAAFEAARDRPSAIKPPIGVQAP